MFTFKFYVNTHPSRCRYDSDKKSFENAVDDLINSIELCFQNAKITEIESISLDGKPLGKKFIHYANNAVGNN